MFLNTDNIKKLGITFERRHNFFRDKKRTIRFHDIEFFYVSSVDHYTNSVYEGHEYILTLGLKQEPEYYQLEACTNRRDSYKIICDIHNAIETHMEKRNLKALDSGDDIKFQTMSNKHLILIRKDKILISFPGQEKTSLKVQKIFKPEDGRVLEFIGEKHKVRIPMEYISNVGIFMSMAADLVPFQVKPKSFLAIWLTRGAYAIGAACGINSWFEIVDGGYWFNAFCTFAGIGLGVTLFLVPCFLLVHKLNMWKMRRQAKMYKNDA